MAKQDTKKATAKPAPKPAPKPNQAPTKPANEVVAAAPVAPPATPAAKPGDFVMKFGQLMVGDGAIRRPGDVVKRDELTPAEAEKFLARGMIAPQ